MTSSKNRMRRYLVLALSSLITAPSAHAQEVSVTSTADAESALDEIIVTAQRQAESLQDVPIAVSVFSAEMLERQQIDNSLDLQLSLPNATYSKTNFGNSNFQIRGIGNTNVAASSDAGVGVHINDMPINMPRLFETEFYDLDRIEVLRGPQGTLFGRNATGGVLNIITKRPTDAFEIDASLEYGNYDSIKAQGVLNIPLGERFGLRLAGLYINRDGYTKNLFDDSRIDGRDSYAIRGTLRFEPSDDTTIDLIASYFREHDDRSRIQKQLCHRDPTGVLGCSPDRLAFEPINANAALSTFLTSREFLALRPETAPLVPFALHSLYGPDTFSGVSNPSDVRTVATDYNPTYLADELIVMGRLEQKLGDQFSLTVTGGYQESSVRSRTDFNLTVANPLTSNPGALALQAAFPAAAAQLFQGGNLCVSSVDHSYVGYIGGRIDRCAPRNTEYDESHEPSRQWSIEAHAESHFDGPFNILLGGIYLQTHQALDYFVAISELDYASLLLGGLTNGLASPFFNSESHYRLKAWAAFGEAYYDVSDRLKLTLGLRYTVDDKTVRDVSPQPLLGLGPIPFGTADARSLLHFRTTNLQFHRLTGRAVIDWHPQLDWTDDTLVYASYARGYKGGGVNPPFNPNLVRAPVSFAPEAVNAFEIGTKNRLLDGTLQANLTAFYYDYKGLQVSRIINRTPFNDNTDAAIYGLEGEFTISPTPPLLFNITASYLHTKIKGLSLIDPRDPSAGRSDTVIIKDITSASNCVVQPSGAGVPRADALVGAVNGTIGLQAPVPIQGTNTTGAFSICDVLAATIANPPAPLRALFGVPTGPLPYVTVTRPNGAPALSEGVAVDLNGNELQNSPHWKFAIGGQYTWDFDSGMSLVARLDYSFTGEYFGRNFNRPVDRIDSYDVINAQLQLNGAQDAWFVRAFVQNLANNNAVTGMYVTDPSAGLFTNIFTLEPRRYGLAAGVRF